MKKVTLLFALALTVLGATAKDIQTAVFTTQPGISCQNCVKRIQDNLRFVKGVKSVEASVEKQTVTVTYDAEKTNAETIRAAFKKIHFTATACPKPASEDKKQEKK